LPEGTLCYDGNACTTRDECSPIGCQGRLRSCSDNNLCTLDSCNPVSGCGHTTLADDTPCGDACSSGGHCNRGDCVGQTVLDCDDGDSFTYDGCDPASGCVHTPVGSIQPGGCTVVADCIAQGLTPPLCVEGTFVCVEGLCEYECNVEVLDHDYDGIPDAADPCPLAMGPDVDGDGVCANVDNCPDENNGDQADTDGDGLGDVCDQDGYIRVKVTPK
jgi:hypothetical protein